MNELMQLPTAHGSIMVEVSGDDAGVRRASRVNNTIQSAAESLESALRPVRQAASAALAEFRNAGPDEVELEFGVRLNAEAGAVIARTGAEGHFLVRLAWRSERGGGEAATHDSQQPSTDIA